MLFLKASVLFATLFLAAPSPQGSLIMPLQCGDTRCSFRYNEGPYTAGGVTSVLDHSLVRNPDNGFYQYGKDSRTSDGIVVAFNGERADGRRKASSGSDTVCIRGAIVLAQVPPRAGIANTRGCGAGYASYDEHPGIDFRAEAGTTVRAAAGGTVLNIGRADADKRCIRTNFSGTCDANGWVGIDHGNGYVTQYGHLNRVSVRPGTTVRQGQSIGEAGSRGTGAAHLHFEVLYKSGGNYLIVDPYGWTGRGRDPLYSARTVSPVRLWQ